MTSMETPAIEFRWGVKASFREYVGEIEGSSQGMLPGAGRLDGGTFVFDPDPAATRWVDSGPRVLAYAGAAQFTAYAGLMNVVIRDPWVEFDDAGTRLTIVDPAAPALRLHLANLKPGEPHRVGGVVRWNQVSARLAIGGMRVFDGVYGPGSELDSVDFATSVNSIN
ncbi:MAG: hypothetical protein JWO18_1843 [Microbacteriaceae bacterium]|jgi:hypothetical protein|nr:hypothetical protein [Microbacteriaceae bacterium]